MVQKIYQTLSNIFKRNFFLNKEIQVGPWKILWVLFCGSLPAEKLSHGQFFVKIFFYTIESFYFPCQIIHTSSECLQLLWPLCVSERGFPFFLHLFTQLEDKHCTLFLARPHIELCKHVCVCVCVG